MRKSILRWLLAVFLLLSALGASIAEEESWSGFEFVDVQEFTYGYRTSSIGNVMLGHITRNVSGEEMQMMLNDPQAFEEMLNSIVIEMPSVIDGKKVTVIDDWFLSGITTPTGIVLPEYLVTIGKRAFADCERLSGEVLIPKTVTSIGEMAFYACPKLESVYIPRSVRVIGEGAFTDCPRLTITVVAGSAGERHAIDNDIPYVYGDSTMPLGGVLTMPVTCYAVDDACVYYRDLSAQAAGIIPGNARVTISEIANAYAVATAEGVEGNVYVPADALSLLPVRDPEMYGWHKDLFLDGKCLSDIESEEALYEYYQDVQLWNDYLFDRAAYVNSHLDAQHLREELALEVYKRYSEPMDEFAMMDMLFDFKSLLGFEVFDSIYRSHQLISSQMPSLETMQTCAAVLGQKDKTYAHDQVDQFLDLYKGVKDIAGIADEKVGVFSKEDLEKIDDFFEELDDRPIIDDIGDVLEDLLDAAGETELWKKAKPLLEKAGKYTQEELEFLGALLPYLEISVSFVELRATVDNLNDAQRASLERISSDAEGTYIQLIVDALLHYEDWYQFYKQAIAAQIADVAGEAGLSFVPFGALLNASTAAGGLLMHFSGTTEAAMSAYNAVLRQYLAQEMVVNGVALEMSLYLKELPAQPTQEQLAALDGLVKEYVRLYDIVKEGSGQSSDFARAATAAIARCRDYDAAASVEPQIPLLFQYQPQGKTDAAEAEDDAGEDWSWPSGDMIEEADTAAGEDEPAGDVPASLLGTWVSHYNFTSTYFTFEADGGYVVYVDGGVANEPQPVTYTVDGSVVRVSYAVSYGDGFAEESFIFEPGDPGKLRYEDDFYHSVYGSLRKEP